MKKSSQRFFLLFFSFACLILSCQKSEDDPTPGTGSLVTGNPVITGISGATVVKDASGSTFTITVPAGTNVKSLKIEIPHQSGSTVSPNPSVARDYTSPVQYTITGSDGSKQTVTVKVVVQQGTKSAAKQITAFSFAALSPVVTATIDETNHKITASVPTGTDLTKLVPTITVSDKATVSPASGVVQNFTNAVNYTVKAEDGSTQVYEVKVNKTVVGSDKACLVTDIDYTDGVDKIHISFQYHSNGSASKITFARGTTTSVSSFEYNSNGDLSIWKTDWWSDKVDEMRFVYTSGKATKIQGYKGGTMVEEVSVADFGLKLNDKNEVTEVLNEMRFGYTNGNITDFQSYNGDKKLWEENIKIQYDTKYNFLSASNAKGLSSFFYWLSGLQSIGMPSFVNNITRASNSALLATLEHTYNLSGFPTKTISKSSADNVTVPITYTYSNCP